MTTWTMTKNDPGFNGATTLCYQFPVGAAEEPGADGAVVLVLVEKNAEGRPEVQAFNVDAAGETIGVRTTERVIRRNWAKAANDAILRLCLTEKAPPAAPADFEAFERACAVRECIERAIKRADEKLANFRAALDKDPAYAFEWGGEALASAATKKVFSRALTILEKCSAEEYAKDLRDDVLLAAKHPARSTSPLSNEVSREILAAQAELLEILES